MYKRAWLALCLLACAEPAPVRLVDADLSEHATRIARRGVSALIARARAPAAVSGTSAAPAADRSDLEAAWQDVLEDGWSGADADEEPVEPDASPEAEDTTSEEPALADEGPQMSMLPESELVEESEMVAAQTLQIGELQARVAALEERLATLERTTEQMLVTQVYQQQEIGLLQANAIATGITPSQR
jgi:hypothetical protein